MREYGERLWGRIMDLSIKAKLILFMYASALALFVALSAILLLLAERASRERLAEQTASTLADVGLLVDNKQQYLRGVADYLSASSALQYALMAGNSGQPFHYRPEEMGIWQSTLTILSTVYYDDDGEPIGFNAIDSSHSPMPQGEAAHFQRLLAGESIYEWTYIPQGGACFMRQDNSPKLCLWRAIRAANDRRVLGVLAVSIDSRSLLDFDDSTKTFREHVIILDGEGSTVYNRSAHTLGNGDAAALLNLSRTAPDGHCAVQLDAGKYYVTHHRQGTGLTLYYLQEHTPFTWNLDAFSVYAMAGIALYCVLLLLFLYFISRMLTRPLEILTISMQRFSEGDYSVRVKFRHNDEIGRLGRVFNDMVRENRRLVESEYHLTLKNKDAELALMQTQVNPHFLYNLTNAIQWRALKSGNNDIADIAYAMAQFFRISLSRNRGIVPLRQEHDLIRYYLALQKVRFGDLFHYTLAFDEVVLDCRIPKLILHPLVENAALHGMGGMDFQFHIEVRACLCHHGDCIRLEVRDNGTGFPAEVLRYLPERPVPESAEAPPGKGNRFALHNIYERLRLTYGKAFSLRLENDGGARVIMILPSRAPERHDKEEHGCCGY